MSFSRGLAAGAQVGQAFRQNLERRRFQREMEEIGGLYSPQEVQGSMISYAPAADFAEPVAVPEARFQPDEGFDWEQYQQESTARGLTPQREPATRFTVPASGGLYDDRMAAERQYTPDRLMAESHLLRQMGEHGEALLLSQHAQGMFDSRRQEQQALEERERLDLVLGDIAEIQSQFTPQRDEESGQYFVAGSGQLYASPIEAARAYESDLNDAVARALTRHGMFDDGRQLSAEARQRRQMVLEQARQDADSEVERAQTLQQMQIERAKEARGAAKREQLANTIHNVSPQPFLAEVVQIGDDPPIVIPADSDFDQSALENEAAGRPISRSRQTAFTIPATGEVYFNLDDAMSASQRQLPDALASVFAAFGDASGATGLFGEGRLREKDAREAATTATEAATTADLGRRLADISGRYQPTRSDVSRITYTGQEGFRGDVPSARMLAGDLLADPETLDAYRAERAEEGLDVTVTPGRFWTAPGSGRLYTSPEAVRAQYSARDLREQAQAMREAGEFGEATRLDAEARQLEESLAKESPALTGQESAIRDQINAVNQSITATNDSLKALTGTTDPTRQALGLIQDPRTQEQVRGLLEEKNSLVEQRAGLFQRLNALRPDTPLPQSFDDVQGAAQYLAANGMPVTPEAINNVLSIVTERRATAEAAAEEPAGFETSFTPEDVQRGPIPLELFEPAPLAKLEDESQDAFLRRHRQFERELGSDFSNLQWKIGRFGPYGINFRTMSDSDFASLGFRDAAQAEEVISILSSPATKEYLRERPDLLPELGISTLGVIHPSRAAPIPKLIQLAAAVATEMSGGEARGYAQGGPVSKSDAKPRKRRSLMDRARERFGDSFGQPQGLDSVPHMARGGYMAERRAAVHSMHNRPTPSTGRSMRERLADAGQALSESMGGISSEAPHVMSHREPGSHGLLRERPRLTPDPRLPYAQYAGGGYVQDRARELGTRVHDYRGGGKVRGPGTETSDSIPAMLSDGEYVINAKAVREVGKDTLDRINARGLTR